ncbi:CbiX/SirB N-terminal domain-containing protein [Fuscovulum ytuae]|uniref:CbiX/SirB N-terminal domain-containing protein n=1 Tax=Fuscovulum ytuae TaxID=3042299 RepID=A0ABY8QA22_9RHOB|nr:CbiX/SirB N-terminal domain-containing protein [Fuscovulum sp. YMD61]WGV17713.1 CbiX/SirB N-terminal domain-containing protein [Fuscovulum sp. YMD61]
MAGMTSRAPLSALIVSHGQPSDPAPAAAEMAFVAAKVQALMPEARVMAATLAEEGALERAVAVLGPTVRVYPMFMAQGWFTRTHLPERLAAAGAPGARVLAPFGLDEAVQALAVTVAREAAARLGRVPADLPVLLAAHGSFKSPAPAEVAEAVAARLRRDGGFARVEAAFIDQSPRIVDAATTFPEGALVLPFFAARGGHVVEDLPQALTEAGFRGTVLPPLGLDPRVPGLIRRALRAAG